MINHRNFSQKRKKQRQNYMGTCLFVLLFCFPALVILHSLTATLNSSNTPELVIPETDAFASSKYQPIQVGSTKKIAYTDFTELDNLAAQLNYQGESIAELATLLAQNANTELEKARIIYAWIAQHITYDVPAFLEAFNNGNYPDVNPAKVLRDRTTICSGYSNLYLALAEAMDLKAVIVAGYARGATGEENNKTEVNHAWNAVSIAGQWYLLDATWGAGSIIGDRFEPQYKPDHFATPPQQFISNHFPADAGWQLTSKIYSREEFNNLADITAHFYNLGLQIISHHNYHIKTDSRINLKFKAPEDIVALATLSQDGVEIPETATLINRQHDNLIVSVAPPKPGSYQLAVYAKNRHNSGQYPEVIKYKIEATDSTASFPKTYGNFSKNQVNLIEPLESILSQDSSVYFNLHVPNALEVKVVEPDLNKWTSLNSYGSYFEGYLEINSTKAVIVARFPEDDRYWQLVEYGKSKLNIVPVDRLGHK